MTEPTLVEMVKGLRSRAVFWRADPLLSDFLIRVAKRMEAQDETIKQVRELIDTQYCNSEHGGECSTDELCVTCAIQALIKGDSNE